MPFEFKPALGPQRPRTKTITVSVVLHVLLIVLILANPSWLNLRPPVRLEGEDYDLRRATMLTLPPPLAPPPADAVPAPPPAPVIAPPPDAIPAPALPLPAPLPAPVAPPPAPLPPPPPMPPSVIRPDDLIADGARPDAPPRPSRGNTPDPARAGSLIPGPTLPPPLPPPPAPSAPPAPDPGPATPPLTPKSEPAATASNAGTRGGALPAQIAQNNQSALRLPSLGTGSASGILNDAIQNASNRPRTGTTTTGGAGRTGNGQGLELPNFNAEEPTILSDTRGYDFGPYLNQVVNRVRVNWYSLIPESVRYNGQRGRVVLTFTIVKSGAVQDLTLRLNSGAEPLDRAAMGSITASNPFQRLPSNFDGDHLTLQFTFLYNIPLQ